MTGLADETKRLLIDSAQKFISQDYPFVRRQQASKSAAGFDESMYQTFAELGWLGVPFPEDFGGFDGVIPDIAELAQEFGKGLVIEPWFVNVVLSGSIIGRGDNQALASQLLPLLISGESKINFALEETHCGSSFSLCQTELTQSSLGFVLNGHKSLVLGCNNPQGFLVIARLAETEKFAICFLTGKESGVTFTPYKLVDGSGSGELILKGVSVDKTQIISLDARALVSQVIDEAMVILGCEALGCMDRLMALSVDYAKTRKQFGVTIGQFQVLRHMLADMSVSLTKTRCLIQHCLALWQQEGRIPSRLASQLKVQIGKAGQHIARESIQIHGGIGMTDELEVGHYVKRLTVIDALFGNSARQLQCLANDRLKMRLSDEQRDNKS